MNRVEHQKLNQTTAELPFGWVFRVQLGWKPKSQPFWCSTGLKTKKSTKWQLCYHLVVFFCLKITKQLMVWKLTAIGRLHFKGSEWCLDYNYGHLIFFAVCWYHKADTLKVIIINFRWFSYKNQLFGKKICLPKISSSVKVSTSMKISATTKISTSMKISNSAKTSFFLENGVKCSESLL